MCTLVTLLSPGTTWPLLIAANRDEMLDRPWRAPAAHWPNQPNVIGGLDVLAGGTWLALDQSSGMVAAILNRTGSLGPEPGKESRGLLPLEALSFPDAASAAAKLDGQDAARWRSFNLIVADCRDVFWIAGLGAGRVAARRFTDGLHMITSTDPDDPDQPRIARHLPRFQSSIPPTPPDWKSWPILLADTEGEPDSALNIRPRAQKFGTASSALIALGPAGPIFHFAAGPPDQAPFLPVTLGMTATQQRRGMA